MKKENEIDIVKLSWSEAIRTRPGMYIGGTSNPSVILREAIDNSIDELYGYSGTDRIYIQTANNDNPWNIVADNGRGIPIKWDEEYEMTKTQLAVTSTHTGSKFNKKDVAIGLNGVGLSATNALSSHFVIISKITPENKNTSIKVVSEYNNSEEGFYVLEMSRGEYIKESAMSHSEIEETYGIRFPEGMSTVTALQPDAEIFESLDCKIPKKNLIYVLAIMEKLYNRKISIEINGKLAQNDFNPYKFEFTKKITNGERSATFYVNFETDKVLTTTDFSGSVNSLIVDRGLNVEVAKLAYQEALKQVYNLTYGNVLYGIRLNSICIATEVDFSSQTKERCTKIEKFQTAFMVKELVPSFVKIIKTNKEYFDVHIERIKEYLHSLTKISTINKIKNAIGTVGGNTNRVRSKLPKSILDASSKSRKDCDLYIVEGRSASASIINTRDIRTQAVLELRGVPMNAINRSLDDILDNPEMAALISAIGIGVNEYHNMKLARYGKIIIAADADPDGQKISALVLGVIAAKMTFLIEKGMVFILESPLYIQNGKFIYPEDTTALDRSKPYTRIKGLGELNDEQAEVAITNKTTRRLIKITPENMPQALRMLTNTGHRKQLMIDQNIVVDPYGLGLWY